MGRPGPNPFALLAQPAPTRGRRKTHLKKPLKKKPLKNVRATALPIGLFDIFLTFVAIAATQHLSQADVCYNCPPRHVWLCLTN
jgi:hypothetical protein